MGRSSDEDDNRNDDVEEEEDDEEEEEDDEEEEEDEEDDDEDERERSKSRKRPKASMFFEEEVEEGSDEEEYEDDEYNAERAEAEREERAMQRKRAQERERRNRANVEDLERRYAEGAVGPSDDAEAAQPRAIRQAGKLPTVRDPKLWMVKCQPGREKEVAIALMRKYLELEYSEEPLLIKSVVAVENLKGHIYVEAFKQAHVAQAVKGLQALRYGQFKQNLVPTEEMVAVMSCVRKVELVPTGAWVRVRRGVLYRDDIAQVVQCDETRGTVTIKMLPRIDYDAIGKAASSKEEILKRKRGGVLPGGKRPPQRLFDPDEVRKAGGEVTGRGNMLVFEGGKFRDGYLVKTFPMNALMIDGVEPTLDELRKFKASDSSTVGSSKSTEVSFQKNDMVMVVQGELANLVGVVESITADSINVRPQLKQIADKLYSFKPSELKRYFKTGDHVKVINGVHEGETGLIVRVEENHVVIFGDTSMDEIKVFNKDVQLALEVSTGLDTLGQFVLYDLVQINPHNVGVIVKMEKEGLKIMDQQGVVKRFRPQEVTPKKGGRNAVALDNGHNSISVDDQVSVVDGVFKGRKGTVKHIFRAFVFLHSHEQLENGGIFVVRAKQCLLAGGKPGGQGGFGGMGLVPQSPRGGFGGMDRGRGGRGGRGRGRGRDTLLHATVSIRGGPHKGLIGIVRECTETTARVELHSRNLTVTIDREKLQLRNADGSKMEGGDAMGGMGRGRGGYGSRTPAAGSQTPRYGSQTPAYGGATPAYGNQTPNAAMTPRPEGSMTPSSAGAWDPSNINTPGGPVTPGSEYSSYDDTPARETYTPSEHPTTPGSYSFNPTTPGSYNPTTPGSYNPQTPGLDTTTTPGSYNPVTPGGYNPHTPAGYNPATPAGGYNPATPGQGYDMTTPGGYNPTTPGNYLNTPGGYDTPGNPITPGIPETPGTYDDSLWLLEGVEVKVVEGDHVGHIGAVRSVDTYDNAGTVYLYDTKETVNLTQDQLEPVPPQKKDRARRIRVGQKGEPRGQSGEVTAIAGNDAIMVLDGSREMTFINLTELAKEAIQ
eukprot:comp23990_c0_seq1/m.42637 comp23990_c0_seq1/g.42637  ORF comp23990_c0_seq1/g.42637 comp23990_c0_seq1/m.42637 type:complete len:1051 (-) comp23990_c0_seq1:111-3263(-)